MKLLPTIACISLGAYTSASPTHKKHSFNWQTTKSVLAFGDSYTFVQGTLGHANYSFINDAFQPSFTPDQLFSNRIVLNQTATTQGTASGGSNWVEYLTNCGVTKGLTDPQTCAIQLWDFAYAGANTVSQTNFTPPHWNHTVSFQEQIIQFEKYGYPALKSIDLKEEDALVAIWIGINDINDLAKLRKNESFAPLYETVQGYVWESVEKIYRLGYKKFLVMNLPPLDRGPAPSVNSSMVAKFNEIVARRAEVFSKKHKDATVLRFDVNSALNGILDNHDDYGFKNVTNFCPGFNQPDIRVVPAKYGCGEGLNTYFWYDSGHLGSRVHKVFTEVLRMWLIKQSRPRLL